MKTIYAGIELEHPIMAASTGATRDAEQAARCEESGFSGVVMKSVQEEVLMRYNPFPRFAVLHNGIPGYNSTTFYSYEQAYYGNIDQYAESVYRAKRKVSIPVIASINCINPETWGEYAVKCEQAGADAIEIVPSCPSGLLIRDPSNDIHAISVAALRLCKEKVKIPVIVKMTCQVANPIHTAMCLVENGTDGLTMFNRSTGIEIDIDKMAPILHGGLAGHGGAWALNSVLRWIIASYPVISAPICATGGVTNGKDVVKCLLAGAKSVQIGTVMYLKGYGYVRKMLEEIQEYMEKKQIVHLSSIIGKASQNLLKMEEYDRVTRYYASVSIEKCIKCKQCQDICIYNAIFHTDDGPVIDKDLCDGCGLCSSICRAGAIKMNIKNGGKEPVKDSSK
ncbi:MAG: 4Fe-4S binding protein [Bacillota bacterium]